MQLICPPSYDRRERLGVDSNGPSPRPSLPSVADSVFGVDDETPEAFTDPNADINQLMDELRQVGRLKFIHLGAFLYSSPHTLFQFLNFWVFFFIFGGFDYFWLLN